MTEDEELEEEKWIREAGLDEWLEPNKRMQFRLGGLRADIILRQAELRRMGRGDVANAIEWMVFPLIQAHQLLNK